MLLWYRLWQTRRVVVTRDVISFSFARDEVELDYIPLADVEFVKLMKDFGDVRHKSSLRSQNEPDDSPQVLQIATRRDGYNSGRAYYLLADSQERLEELLDHIQRAAKAARKRAEAAGAFRGWQGRVRRVYETAPAQAVVAAVIAAVRASAK